MCVPTSFTRMCALEEVIGSDNGVGEVGGGACGVGWRENPM